MHDQAQKLRDRLLAKQVTQQSARAKTLAVISGKGGVGKSNFALNFALALSQRQQRVLVFDLDIGMGNIDILTGSSAKYNLVDLFKEGLSMQDLLTHGPESLTYIAGGSGLSDFFQLDAERFEYFLSQFDQITKDYDYIIFDMGAGISQDSLSFILAAEEAILVTTHEPTSMTDAYAILKHIYRMEKEIKIYTLINRAYSRQAGKEAMERLQKVVQQFLTKELHPMGILPDDNQVMKAVARQVPFLLLNQNSPASKAVQHITDQYLENKLDITRPPATSFVTKLKRLVTER
ncbi:flagellar biosynthesis protein FlhG [Thalassobacillus cyri]|uniref:Flagellar biosynthesis protein FlhG n=1 Tax=Thalassobacillus cyri TaxID=571932 RepID=A0A1H4G039_9BACI|nr:MinD/ParA family protein [Thalassobacillus cyri]SEB03006.1 flagellar biosynthesis protein FlhG [Thalassobacillus cyri]